MDGVGGAVFDQEGEEGEDAMDEEGDNEDVDDDKDGDTTTHSCGGPRKGGRSGATRWRLLTPSIEGRRYGQ